MNRENSRRGAFLAAGVIFGVALAFLYFKLSYSRAPVVEAGPAVVEVEKSASDPLPGNRPRPGTRTSSIPQITPAVEPPEEVAAEPITPILPRNLNENPDPGGSRPITMLVANAVQTYRTGGNVLFKISLRGDPPPEKEIVAANADAVCGPHLKAPMTTRFFRLSADRGLADVTIFVKSGLQNHNFEVPATDVELDQVGCEYQPYVLCLQTKQKLVIKNSDPFLHNVNASAKVEGNRPFNEAQMGKGPVKIKSFAQPELLIPFACNVHPWMFAYVSVFDHPYFALTDTNGSASINNLPAGEYEIGIRHRKLPEAGLRIIVDPKTEGPTELKLTLDVN